MHHFRYGMQHHANVNLAQIFVSTANKERYIPVRKETEYRPLLISMYIILENFIYRMTVSVRSINLILYILRETVLHKLNFNNQLLHSVYIRFRSNTLRR